MHCISWVVSKLCIGLQPYLLETNVLKKNRFAAVCVSDCPLNVFVYKWVRNTKLRTFGCVCLQMPVLNVYSYDSSKNKKKIYLCIRH